jgi:23S rRNA pseudouridine2605 synthase
MMRINKYLAQCGVASRRAADDLVVAGRVAVNGETIETPGHMVDEAKDAVTVDGKPAVPQAVHTYVVMNKPAGYVTSMSDPHHRKTVNLLLKGVGKRVYPVGRLDLDTEGALLFTDDGELAHRLSHPRYGVSKIYLARVEGNVAEGELAQFSKGIKLPDGVVGKAQAVIKASGTGYTDLELTLTEGRKREVKHLCKAIGHPVINLVRLSFGGIKADDLASAAWRYLTDDEVLSLKKLAGL